MSKCLEWFRKQGDIHWVGDYGQELMGDFNATTAGYGLPLRSTRTWIMRGNADDGGIALGTGQAYLFGSRRMLLTYAQSGNISAMGGCDRLSIAANETNISGVLSGHWGMLEGKSGGYAPANAGGCGAVRGDINFQSGSNIPTGGVVSAFLAACEALSQSGSGKTAVIHVPNPQAGTFDYFAYFGSTTGCIGSSTAHGGVTPTLWLNVNVGGTAYFIPMYGA